MAEWLYEQGLGENRAALIIDGALVAARIEPDTGTNTPRPGAILPARLGPVVVKGRSARALLDNGGEVLLTRLPKGVSEGRALLVEITREAVVEPGHIKLPLAIPLDEGATVTPGLTLLDRITASGVPVSHCLPHEPDYLEQAGWSECLDEAATGLIPFDGGVLRMSLTPAMTIFDVDGTLPPFDLAKQAARAVGAAIIRHDLAGSIGIDFPTFASKDERLAVADVLDDALRTTPQAGLLGTWERTAVNGFGFLQLVRQRRYQSLPEQCIADPVGHRARALLRQISRIAPPVPADHRVDAATLRWLTAHPALHDQLRRLTASPITFAVA